MRASFSWHVLTIGILAAMVVPGIGLAVTSGPCEQVPADKKQLVAKLLRSLRPHACCKEPLEQCLRQKRVCRVARRLADEICRRAARGDDEQKIATAMQKRAQTMRLEGRTASFDLSGAQAAGEEKADVVAVVYACPRCPYCKIFVPELHRLATEGPLKGVLKVYFRPYPISSHSGSTEGGLAFAAATRLGKLWRYSLRFFAEYDRFSRKQLGEWARQVGLDREAFQREMRAPATRAALVELKKEGLRNGVDVTPSLFISGRRYRGALDTITITDVIEEEADRLAGRIYVGKAAGKP